MALVLRGKEVADALTAQMKRDVEQLRAAGTVPTLCIFRVGERPDDLSYERGAVKRASMVGVEVKKVVLPADVSQEEFDSEFRKVNEDDSIHGILLFRPLPRHLDSEKARQMLDPAKDARICPWPASSQIRRPDSRPAPLRLRWRSFIILRSRSRAKKQPSSAAPWSSGALSP